jgi:hypothetical protein
MVADFEVAIMVIEMESVVVAHWYPHFVELVWSEPMKAKLSLFIV